MIQKKKKKPHEKGHMGKQPYLVMKILIWNIPYCSEPTINITFSKKKKKETLRSMEGVQRTQRNHGKNRTRANKT